MILLWESWNRNEKIPKPILVSINDIILDILILIHTNVCILDHFLVIFICKVSSLPEFIILIAT